MGPTTSSTAKVTQFKKPRGWLGRLLLRNMNARHSTVTDWGLAHISIESHYTILDIGCGGGRTLYKLAERATQGKVYGVDYSDASIAASSKMNAQWLDVGRVEVRPGTVSQLPFPDGMFDLVTAVETHFWWPNLTGDVREILRVVKPGGTFIIIAEVYKGANTKMAKMCEKQAPQTGMTLLDADEHRELLVHAGFSDVQVFEEQGKGWISTLGKRP